MILKEIILPIIRHGLEKKSNDEVYVALDKTKQLRGLLKLKLEDIKEDYSDIKPLFKPAQRLKICSFKAHFTAQKLGQRFMRIVFETAMSYRVDEIYVTIFANSIIKDRLIGMLEQWGFKLWGKNLVFLNLMIKKRMCMFVIFVKILPCKLHTAFLIILARIEYSCFQYIKAMQVC